MVESVVGSVRNSHPYFDNIIVASPTYEQHCRDVYDTFKALNEANMTVNKAKTTVGLKEIKTLGHVINGAGISPDPAKVEAIRSYPIPTTKKQLKSFLCLVSWLRNPFQI